MTTATEQVDLEALEQDARRTLEELTEARARLSLDALSDARVAAELEDVESEIRSCEQALERVGLACGEQGRRAQQAAEKAAREAAEHAMRQARALQADRARGAVAIDQALSELAARVSAWLECCGEQDRALRAAGRRPAQGAARRRVLAQALDAAFAFAMRPLPRGILTLEATTAPRHVMPLGQGDMRPVEPLEHKSGRANQKTER